MLEENRQNWQRIKDVFAATVEKPRAMRTDFLREICENDDFLRTEIESLLDAYDAHENIIEENAFDFASKLSLAILEKLDALEPNGLTYKFDIGTIHTNLGAAKIGKNDLESAITQYEKAAEIFHKILEKSAENRGELRHLALTYRYIGEAYQKSNGAESAKRNFQKSLEFYNKLETQNALTEYDRKDFEKLKTVVQSSSNQK
ncbi:MAG: tetratricopeptide repeat protein [Pyrinomonadaceae bacterium]|nr:tetratricopeptide repeat protein [Pyrinomonadaceae bacterium]